MRPGRQQRREVTQHLLLVVVSEALDAESGQLFLFVEHEIAHRNAHDFAELGINPGLFEQAGGAEMVG